MKGFEKGGYLNVRIRWSARQAREKFWVPPRKNVRYNNSKKLANGSIELRRVEETKRKPKVVISKISEAHVELYSHFWNGASQTKRFTFNKLINE